MKLDEFEPYKDYLYKKLVKNGFDCHCFYDPSSDYCSIEIIKPYKTKESAYLRFLRDKD